MYLMAAMIATCMTALVPAIQILSFIILKKKYTKFTLSLHEFFVENRNLMILFMVIEWVSTFNAVIIYKSYMS